MPSTYRPRNPSHDYYGRGIYLITLVVSGRAHLLSHFVTDFGHETSDSSRNPVAVLGHEVLSLTPLGEEIQQAWQQTPVMIHLQKEPIGPYWKPERRRFEACLRGNLLILAPWDINALGDVSGVPADSDYSRFHNLNTLAAEICAFYGEARIQKS